MTNDIITRSATDIVTKIKNRELSAVEVLEAFIRQITKVNPHINALVQMNLEAALDEAKALDNNKTIQGKLAGLPVTIKNVCHVRGFSPDKGLRQLSNGISTTDATIVKRLREQGAIIIGLTNSPEFTIGFETDNILYGRTNNPHHLAYTPGGSSGGEAAIIAAGGSPLGIGSDASGSVRVPAHFTGIAAIKATQGRIPYTGTIPIDVAGLLSQFISFGPMARFVEDLDLVLPIICGPDHLDSHTVPVTLHSSSDVALNQLKIAYYSNDGISTPTADTVATIQRVISTLQKEVFSITESCPTLLKETEDLLHGGIFLGGDEGKWLKDLLVKLNITEISPLLKEFIKLAEKSKFSVTDVRLSWQKLDFFRNKMLLFFQNYDAIICPVAATPAKKHGDTFEQIRDFSYAMSYNLVNWPVVVVRCGTSSEGLPIGVQVIAKPWREDIALAVAAYLQKSLGGWKLAPLAAGEG